MPNDWKKSSRALRWTFRQAMMPRPIARVLFAVAVLIDLRIFLNVENSFVAFFSIVLLILLVVTSYRRGGKWYDWQDSGSDEWQYIKSILMLEFDPLRCPSKPLRWHIVWWKDQPGLLIFVIAVAIFACRLCHYERGSLVCYLLCWVSDDWSWGSSTGNTVVLAALITATAAVITIVMTVRQNTRAANREAWNSSIRELMAKLIAGVPRKCCKLKRARKRHRHQYFELALQLNPSEKAHRGLLYAVAVMYGAENHWARNDPTSCHLRSFDRRKKCPERLMQGIIRLSNVVCKTEWEQVKKLT